MVLSAVFVLVVAQSSSEIPEGLTNNPVLLCNEYATFVLMAELTPVSQKVWRHSTDHASEC